MGEAGDLRGQGHGALKSACLKKQLCLLQWPQEHASLVRHLDFSRKVGNVDL